MVELLPISVDRDHFHPKSVEAAVQEPNIRTSSAASSGIQAKQWRLRIGPLFRCEGTGKCLPGNHQGGRPGKPRRSLCLKMIKPLRTSYPGRKRMETGVIHSCLLVPHYSLPPSLSLSLFSFGFKKLFCQHSLQFILVLLVFAC